MAQQNTNEAPKGDKAADTSEEQGPYLGTWKDKGQAEEGLTNMQKLLDSQGNELGALRKQNEMMVMNQNQQPAQQAPAEPQAPAGPDYAKELSAIDSKIAALDMDEPDYQAKQVELNAKSRALVADQATQRALDAAQKQFSETLNQRDVQQMQQKFHEQNPDFQSPEMQLAIDEFLQNDQTGMHDQMSAYFAIQGQGAGQGLTEAQTRIAELEERLNIAGGQDDVGKVVTKSQSPRQTTKTTKATGKDLDQGMMDAFNNVR